MRQTSSAVCQSIYIGGDDPPICLSALQVLADGSYSIGPRRLTEAAVTARVEHCLVRDSEHRARVVFNLKRLGADNAWRVLNTEVCPVVHG